MTTEFPPPDARLAGKVKIIKFSAPTDALPDGQLNGAKLQRDADGEISRLSKLSKLQYERERKPAAKRLNFRTAALDQLVAAKQHRAGADKEQGQNKQGRALSLPEPKPWLTAS